ncbi:MAG: hypothetical protein ACI9EK_002951 [Psychroserpens sp.]|jgi:hypothetical protein
MIPCIEDCYFDKRIDSVLIAVKTTGEQVPVVKFKQNYIDLQIAGKDPSCLSLIQFQIENSKMISV